MTRLKRLIVEAHRRSLWQVLGIYLLTSWVGYQVVLALADGVGLPDWVPAFAIVLFIIGLPIVLATAFVQEGGPLRQRDEPAATSAPADPTLFGAVDAAPSAAAPPSTPARAARHHIFLTWQRSLLAGIVAFLLLGVTAGGYIGMRNAGVGPFGSLVTSGRLDAQTPVLVADFTATGADTVMAMAVAQAFRAGLAQSDAINVVNATQVTATLRRMGREGAKLDVPLAREVAERDGLQAVVVGDVTQAGGRYTLSVSLIAPDGSSLMSPVMESADDAAGVLDAVDKLAKRVRERIGDSFRSLRRSAPLSAVTTSSLEALRRYTLGARAYDLERKIDVSIALLQEAVALDSTFAMAWRKLAAVYGAARADQALIVHAATKAYDNRERLTEAERYQAIALYHLYATQDRRRALAAYESLLEISPHDASLNNMGNLYMALGDDRTAVATYERAIASDSANTTPWLNLMRAYTRLGQWDEVERYIELYTQRFGETPDVILRRLMLAAGRGDYAAAERDAQRVVAIGNRSPAHLGIALELQQELEGAQGRMRDAARIQQQSIALANDRGFTGVAARNEALAARRLLDLARDEAAALRALDAVTARLPQINPRDRPYDILALSYADAGQPQRARELTAQLERELPPEEVGDRRIALLYMKGAIAIAEQRDDDALRELRAAAQNDLACVHCSAWYLARAHDRAGRADSAAVWYQRYLDTTDVDRIRLDGYVLGATLERLSELYLALGRNREAAATAARFTKLWQNADAELQPRVRAKLDMLARLQEARN